MGRTFRILRAAFTLASLLLFGAAGSFWLRSHAVHETAQWRRTTYREPVARFDLRFVTSADGWFAVDVGCFRGVYAADEVDETVGWRHDYRAHPADTARGWANYSPVATHSVRLGDARIARYDSGDLRDAAGRLVSPDKSSDSWMIVLPYWAVAALAGLSPGVAVVRLTRRRRRLRYRRRTGRCVACGYDLRGSPDRCPECGAVPTEANRNAEAQRRFRTRAGPGPSTGSRTCRSGCTATRSAWSSGRRKRRMKAEG